MWKIFTLDPIHADNMGLSSFKFSWWALKMHVFWNRVRNGRSRSSKVIDFGTNGQPVCNFLLVIIITLVLSCPVSEISQMFAENSDPTPIPPEFWGVNLGLDRWCCGSEEWNPELINSIITFKVTQPIWPPWPQTEGQLTTAVPRFALRASLGKNGYRFYWTTVYRSVSHCSYSRHSPHNNTQLRPNKQNLTV